MKAWRASLSCTRLQSDNLPRRFASLQGRGMLPFASEAIQTVRALNLCMTCLSLRHSLKGFVFVDSYGKSTFLSASPEERNEKNRRFYLPLSLCLR